MATEDPTLTTSGRSFTYPMCYAAEQAIRKSPFSLRKEDGVKLASSDGFQIIRKLLAHQQGSTFCGHHQPSSKADEEAWLLHRDITHALILPVLQIYRQASQIAASFLCSRGDVFDLELAFRGEARGAFSWLQCLIVEEEQWCQTRGCPACIVTHTLQCEPTIRLILTACRLSRSLRKPRAGRSLPLFDFWRSTLRRALDEDPFWGPAYSKDIENRAAGLEEGVKTLIRQCCELSEVIAARDAESGGTEKKVAADIRPTTPKGRPLSVAQKEQGWLQQIVVSCWTTLLADAAKGIKEQSDGPKSPTSEAAAFHRRSSTI
ncbi:MAG: hypothetical protein MMC33_009293 [Icmadophila ericetorum]|nr:hypothetical protein [Icmadophila ericetorum]